MGNHRSIQKHPGLWRTIVRAVTVHVTGHSAATPAPFDPESTMPMTIVVADKPRTIVEHGAFDGPVDGWLPTYTWLAQHSLDTKAVSE